VRPIELTLKHVDQTGQPFQVDPSVPNILPELIEIHPRLTKNPQISGGANFTVWTATSPGHANHGRTLMFVTSLAPHEAAVSTLVALPQKMHNGAKRYSQ
jgi:hypothetical protein